MMQRTGSPMKRKQSQVASEDGLIRAASRRPDRSEGWVSGTFSPRSENARCDEMTPPPEPRMLRNPPTPPVAAPRSPWKKARRGGGSPNSTFEEDYFDEERVWTSGEHFKFDHNHSHSRSETPNSLSAEGVGRLSIGTLDLSGNSENSLYASTDREDENGGAHSPKGCNNDSAMLSMSSSQLSATNISQASTKYPSSSSPSRLPRDFAEYPPSPAVPQAHRLGISQGTPDRSDRLMAPICFGGPSEAPHQAQPPPFPAIPAPALRSPLRAHDSPLHPQRLFNPPQPSRPFRDGQVHTRRNPFLGVDAVSFSPHEVTRQLPSRTPRLTVRSFLYDFFDFKEIGRGNSGRVYKCYRKIDLCPYAVKEINTAGRSSKQKERLLREIYAHSSQVDNVHVVRYYNAWEQDDVLFIQTELCAGTLAKLRDQGGPLAQDRLCVVLVQLAAGLAYMHAHNLAHMDVKPDNMFWTERGVYKLGDFGLVTPADAADHLIDDGDKRYLSRELLQGDFKDITKGDVFALGLSMFELASDRPIPTEGDGYHAMREGRFPPLPPCISQDMVQLLSAMMHEDPSQRPSAADVIRHPMLFPFLRDESAACLRAEPSPTRAAVATVADGEMVKTHLRALEAEKKVARLEAALKEAEKKLSIYKECVQGAMRGSDRTGLKIAQVASA